MIKALKTSISSLYRFGQKLSVLSLHYSEDQLYYKHNRNKGDKMKVGDLVRYDQDYHDIEGLFLVVEVSFYDKNYSNAVKLRCVTDGTEYWQPSRDLEVV